MRGAILAALLVVLTPLAGHAGRVWEIIRGKRDLEVITVTEVSSTGNFLPAPSPDEPQYYVAASLGYHDLGSVMGGNQPPLPPGVVRLISAELAKRGYLPATPRSPPPSLMLVFAWGTLNADYLPSSDPGLPPIQLNRGQIVRFLGGRKAGIDDEFLDPLFVPDLGLSVRDYEARNLVALAREDFYVIVVSAYPADARLHRKRPPLWTTRIAAPSLGFRMTDAFPAMLAIAGPHFGRDTPRPVWINANKQFQPKVTMGELQLIEYLKEDPLPLTDLAEVVSDEIVQDVTKTK